jgi:hypothetical protein
MFVRLWIAAKHDPGEHRQHAKDLPRCKVGKRNARIAWQARKNSRLPAIWRHALDRNPQDVGQA